MEKKYARLAALLAAAVLCGNGAPSMADNIFGTENNGWHTVIDSDHTGSVYGNQNDPDTTTGTVTGHVEMTKGTVTGYVYGGYSSSKSKVSGSTVAISGGKVTEDVYGGYSNGGEVSGSTVMITDGTVGTVERRREVYGGWSNKGAATGNTVTITGGEVTWSVYGGYSKSNSKVSGNTVTITGGKVSDVLGAAVCGGESNGGAVTGNTVTITGDSVVWAVFGGFSNRGGEVSGNTVTISGGSTVEDSVFGGSSNGDTDVTGNTVALLGSADVSEASLYGRNDASTGSGNTLLIDGWSGPVKSLHNFDSIEFRNVELSPKGKKSTELTVEETVDNIADDAVKITSLAAGDYASGKMTATVSWDSKLNNYVNTDAIVGNHYFCGDREAGGLYVNQFDTTVDTTKDHEATINANVLQTIVAGRFIDEKGAIHQNSTYEGDTTPQTLVIGDGFTTNAGTVAGAYAAGGQTAEGGSVRIESTGWNGTVYGGYSKTGAAAGNTVYVGGYDETDKFHPAEAGGVTVVGGEGSEISRNTLAVTGNGNTLKGIEKLSSIDFQQVAMAKETEDSTAALTLSDTNGVDLGGTSLHVSSLVGGNTYAAGDHVTLLSSAGTIENAPEEVEVSEDIITAGVTQDLSVETVSDANSVGLTVKSVALNPQTDLIAENRAVAAAFVNQGADIAADSLRLLDDGYHYGTQTFGAVYGNRSQYDVNSDIKINGWSEIAGFGNIHEVKGGRLAWGVFYENGTGNYRTWNTFNNEMFRGDGSLLYNGGGAAIRLTKDSGMYYEASLRAGTLSSSMSNAVKDGDGNSYGFDSDSTYWGAHVGAGKLIQRGSGQWDIYGKYFHTDIDGDSFEMGGDRFSFDSVTSDRLRLGARYTADTDKAWSLYCGAAYEYEFSGGSHMKAGQFEAPEQSLQGSTVFGEIGTVWGRKDSPWSMDVNLRGYAGEREGFSGMVQLAYAF